VVTDYNAVLFSQNKVILLIDLISNIDGANVEEEYFCKVIELLDQNLVFFFKSWFQGLQEFYHEIAVNLVLPGVEIFLYFAKLFGEGKVFSKVFHENWEQVLVIEGILNVLRNLIEQIEILFNVKSCVLIVFPLIMKELFYLLGKLHI